MKTMQIKKGIIKKMSIAFVGFLGVFFSGCSSSEEPFDLNDGRECKIIVQIQPTGSQQREISSSSPDAEAIVINENNVNNLSLYMISAENASFPLVSRYLGHEGEIHEYEATLNVDSDYVRYDSLTKKFYLTGRLVAMANMPSGNPLHPLNQSPFDLTQVGVLCSLPMWGVTQIKDLEVKVNDRIDNGTTIELLRSLPKFTFRLDDSIRDEFMISEVRASFDDFEQTAYCQPGAALTASDTKDMDEEDWFNPAALNAAKGKNYLETISPERVVIYTGERTFDNAEFGSRYFEVTLSRKDGSGVPFTGKIYMCDYTPSGMADFDRPFSRIVRNHDYHYVISLASMEMIVSFRDWIYGGKVHIELE